MARTAPDILFGKSSEGPDDNQALKTTIRRPSTSSTRNPGVHQPARHEVLRPQPARFEVPETISRRPSDSAIQSPGCHQPVRNEVPGDNQSQETINQLDSKSRRPSTSSIRSPRDNQSGRHTIQEPVRLQHLNTTARDRVPCCSANADPSRPSADLSPADSIKLHPANESKVA